MAEGSREEFEGPPLQIFLVGKALLGSPLHIFDLCIDLIGRQKWN